jgi:hypothetical protein
MLLAEAIAAAKARGLKWTVGATFTDEDDHSVPAAQATHCCAVGGLILAGRATLKPETGIARQRNLRYVHIGNDYENTWDAGADDRGESLGWAFRCAMEET